jgi:hypothetical protein
VFSTKPYSKVPSSLINNVSKAYVMSKYLQEFCGLVGEQDYKVSPVRLEHGTGTGFFGVSNTGSTDCIKERFRGITDGLGLKYNAIGEVFLRSRTCKDMKKRDRKLHRVEHTYELIAMYKDFEDAYIVAQKPFTANDLATTIIEKQIVCLIEQKEQKTGEALKQTFNKDMPFSKYTADIYCDGINVSKFSKDDIFRMNRKIYGELLELIALYDFSEAVHIARKRLISEMRVEAPLKHTLPPMSLSIEYAGCEFSLLKHHYSHKLKKRMDSNSRWYNETDTNRYKAWLEVRDC